MVCPARPPVDYMRQKPRLHVIRRIAGFTLIELVIVIVILGVMAAVAIPVIGAFLSSSKETATKEELMRLTRAIAGTGAKHDRGFEADVGYPPQALVDLITKPDSINTWDVFLDLGWNGPYIDGTGGEYLTDAWGQAYIYDPATRTILSVGSGDTIAMGF